MSLSGLFHAIRKHQLLRVGSYGVLENNINILIGEKTNDHIKTDNIVDVCETYEIHSPTKDKFSQMVAYALCEMLKI